MDERDDPRDITEDIWPDPDETQVDDDYVEPWRRQTTRLGGSEPEPLNGHLTQLKPRRDRRNPALDEAVERNKPQKKRRSNLIV